MAHPLTQQPPSALPFTSASRPSLLGFGFGYPTSAASFGLHAGQFGGNGIPSLGEGSSSGTPFSSTKRFSPTSKAAVSSDQPAQRSLKRTRLSRSPSPPSSPRSTSSVSSSPRLKSRDLWKGSEKEDLTVGALAINNPSRRTNGSRKEVKRLRRDDLTENGVSERSAGEVDVGVLLATLPPSAHLPILLDILSKNPTLSASILPQIPLPDLGDCVKVLEKCMSRVHRSAGDSHEGLDPARRWEKAKKDGEAFCGMATSYLTFFTSPPATSQPRPSPQTIYSLLYALTIHVYSILHIAPNSSDASTSGKPILDLAHTVLSSWTSWLSSVSEDVNQGGGMYPHSIVSVWADGLDNLSEGNLASTLGASNLSWSGGGSAWGNVVRSAADPRATDQVLVTSFRSAVSQIRNHFVSELGWLVGRHRPD